MVSPFLLLVFWDSWGRLQCIPDILNVVNDTAFDFKNTRYKRYEDGVNQ